MILQAPYIIILAFYFILLFYYIKNRTYPWFKFEIFYLVFGFLVVIVYIIALMGFKNSREPKDIIYNAQFLISSLITIIVMIIIFGQRRTNEIKFLSDYIRGSYKYIFNAICNIKKYMNNQTEKDEFIQSLNYLKNIFKMYYIINDLYYKELEKIITKDCINNNELNKIIEKIEIVSGYPISREIEKC